MAMQSALEMPARKLAAKPISTVETTLTINGEERRLAIEPWTTLPHAKKSAQRARGAGMHLSGRKEARGMTTIIHSRAIRG